MIQFGNDPFGRWQQDVARHLRERYRISWRKVTMSAWGYDQLHRWFQAGNMANHTADCIAETVKADQRART
jgi:hypothetical protein